jgi:hypothetical protein
MAALLAVSKELLAGAVEKAVLKLRGDEGQHRWLWLQWQQQ